MLRNKVDTSKMKKLRASWKLNKPDLFGPHVSLGEDVVHVLVVSEGPNQVAKDSPLPSAITHSENRRKRWRELNDILDKNKKAKTNGGDGTSTGYSYVRWSEVKSVLDYEFYRQNRKPIPEDKFNFLWEYLTYASKAMNGYADAAKEAKRYHFIAPVLIMLCNLFDDVNLEVEESVDGNNVHANGFLSSCSPAALVGCEAVADREGVYVVYGIVTDFIKWQLYRSGENSIVVDSCTIGGSAETIDIKTLRDMCEMIYGALSDHEQECKQEKPK
ncbi:hypothetical protein PC118_g18109 [Phytophthora cactorum]|uniref:Uncharacterized protein n=3 Tax=Phytophthora cactorum TaxID=29920 RepID=A0A8T1FBZ5_9STRA|nr:hypothetical protein PC112_g14237 [Phytophthora cactorum]KAG2968275.1 hypothetical protein PC118_g18109 [Phytophthora cactorum]KAG3004111.1 hypothetical protein PC120_g18784 [Phytophthora cactorum]KAG4045340.1 hypothetical protein PC123_g19249 [Phytophthora cactorum]